MSDRAGEVRHDYGPKGCCGPEAALLVLCVFAALWWPVALLAPPVAVLTGRAVRAAWRSRRP